MKTSSSRSALVAVVYCIAALSSVLGAGTAFGQGHDVTPISGTKTVLAGTSSSVQFTISNYKEVTDTWWDTFYPTCQLAGPLENCDHPVAVSVERGSSANVTVEFDATAGSGGTGELYLHVEDHESPGSPVTGMYTVTVNPSLTTVIAAQASTSRPKHSGPYEAVFRVVNPTAVARQHNFTCTATNGIACLIAVPSSTTLPGNSEVAVLVRYSVASLGGQITLTADGTSGGSGQMSITVTSSVTEISLAQHNYSSQDMQRCAADCFAAVHVQSTVPYFSLGAPRAISLVYHGDRAVPRPFLLLDVKPAPGTSTPLRYWLQAKLNGTWISFVNGEGVTGPMRFSAPAGGQFIRIGGQFDASGHPTGVYPLEIVVTAEYASSTSSTAITSQILIVNEIPAHIARGWTISGVQRLNASNGSPVITEGDGSAVYFHKACTNCALATPPGEFSRLVGSAATGWTRVYPDSTKVTFNGSGFMTEVRDRFGNATTFKYVAGKLDTVIDPLGKKTVLNYSANGLQWIRDPGSRYTYTTVDANRRLIAIKDPDGDSTRFEYDAAYRLVSVINRHGHKDTLNYDPSSGKLSAIRGPAVVIQDSLGPRSPVTQLFAWQSKGVPFASTSGTPMSYTLTDSVYGRTRAPGGAEKRFAVDTWGQPTRTWLPLNRTRTVLYDQRGLPVRVESPWHPPGVYDTVAYNSDGQPIYTEPAGTEGVRIRYGPYGQADSIWGGGQPTQRRFIGPNGRLDSIKVNNEFRGRLVYDGRGRVEYLYDANRALSARRIYDASTGNIAQTILPGNRTTTTTYDAHGRVSSVLRPMSPTVRTFYGIMNQTDSVRIETATPMVARYYYTSLRLDSIRDYGDNRYGFVYNALGWLIRRIDAAGGVDSIGYGLDGELRRRTNRRGQSVSISYDSLGRPLSKTGTNTVSTSWTYTDVPGLTQIVASNAAATDTAWLNVRGQLDSVRTALAGQVYSLRYRYSPIGLLDTLTISGGGIAFTTRQYGYDDARGALTSIKLGSKVTQFALDANLQPSAVIFPGGDVKVLTNGTLQAPYALLAGGSVTEDYGLAVERWIGLDDQGRIALQLTNDGSRGPFFEFDELGRLKHEHFKLRTETFPPGCDDPDAGYTDLCWSEEDWSIAWSKSFSYDALGNRTDLGGTYSAGSRITTFNGCSYLTDPDGNVVKRYGPSCAAPLDTLTWDTESRLQTIKVGLNTLSYHYDAQDRLVRIDKNGATQRHFLWAGESLVAELTPAGTAVTAEYSYYPGVDNLHAVIIGGTIHYAHTDHLGNVIALSNESKEITAVYEYGTWGETATGQSGDPAVRARWKGALWLGNEVDLYYMRRRVYESGTGRFLSEDPLGLAAGFNLYTFANGDPINYRDPFGLCEVEWLLLVTTHPNGKITVEVLDWKWVDCEGEGGDGRGTDARPQPDECKLMAAVAGAIAEHSADEWQFAASFGHAAAGLRPNVVVGNLYDGWLKNGQNPLRAYLPAGAPGGFRQEYGGDDIDNARHFAAFTWSAWINGDWLSRQYARIREDMTTDVGRKDHALSIAAIDMYQALKNGDLSLRRVHDYIRSNICGSSGARSNP